MLRRRGSGEPSRGRPFRLPLQNHSLGPPPPTGPSAAPLPSAEGGRSPGDAAPTPGDAAAVPAGFGAAPRGRQSLRPGAGVTTGRRRRLKGREPACRGPQRPLPPQRPAPREPGRPLAPAASARPFPLRAGERTKPYLQARRPGGAPRAPDEEEKAQPAFTQRSPAPPPHQWRAPDAGQSTPALRSAPGRWRRRAGC